ncbi:hypothetical protein PAPYR_5710 [Paratrimastix pyriformis]|uniref:Reticulon domain-containing protein n=1 Tax=Paratrimastix pyriformis TaxID=342808 RepID=A0ABQ8UGZ4_9EUKA|nr:hypothetical protein PAPYR_5710 [Paratrimastix pyriformis]
MEPNTAAAPQAPQEAQKCESCESCCAKPMEVIMWTRPVQTLMHAIPPLSVFYILGYTRTTVLELLSLLGVILMAFSFLTRVVIIKTSLKSFLPTWYLHIFETDSTAVPVEQGCTEACCEQFGHSLATHFYVASDFAMKVARFDDVVLSLKVVAGLLFMMLIGRCSFFKLAFWAFAIALTVPRGYVFLSTFPQTAPYVEMARRYVQMGMDIARQQVDKCIAIAKAKISPAAAAEKRD